VGYWKDGVMTQAGSYQIVSTEAVFQRLFWECALPLLPLGIKNIFFHSELLSDPMGLSSSGQSERSWAAGLHNRKTINYHLISFDVK
jgi:hypothetical protein